MAEEKTPAQIIASQNLLRINWDGYAYHYIYITTNGGRQGIAIRCLTFCSATTNNTVLTQCKLHHACEWHRTARNTSPEKVTECYEQQTMPVM